MERKKGVILSYVLMIFEVLSTLFLTPFLLRTLGQAEFGVYKLSASITAYLLLLDLGVGNAIIKFVSKFRICKDVEAEHKFVAVGICFYGAIAAIALIAGMVLVSLFPTMFRKGLSSEEILLGQKLLVLTVINAAITIGTTLFHNILIAYERFDISKGVSILQIIIRILLTVFALKVGYGSLGVVSVNLMMTILTRSFFAFYVVKKLKVKPCFHGISRGFVKEIFAYSGLILIQMVATQINASLDQILLGAFVASSATIITVYSIGTQVVQYFQSIGSAFSGVLMPGVVRMVERQSSSDAIRAEMVRIGRMVLMVLGIIWGVFLIFGRQFIFLWAGKENSEAFFVAILLMTAYLFILSESIGTQILWAKNEHKEQSVLKLTIVFVNIVLTIMLIKWNPLLGATIGTFLSLLMGDIVVMNVIFAKKLHISMKRYYKELFRGIWLCILIAVISGWGIDRIPLTGWIGLGIKILVMCLVYVVSLFMIGMNSGEKKLIYSLLRIKEKEGVSEKNDNRE